MTPATDACCSRWLLLDNSNHRPSEHAHDRWQCRQVEGDGQYLYCGIAGRPLERHFKILRLCRGNQRQLRNGFASDLTCRRRYQRRSKPPSHRNRQRRYQGRQGQDAFAAQGGVGSLLSLRAGQPRRGPAPPNHAVVPRDASSRVATTYIAMKSNRRPQTPASDQLQLVFAVGAVSGDRERLEVNRHQAATRSRNHLQHRENNVVGGYLASGSCIGRRSTKRAMKSAGIETTETGALITACKRSREEVPHSLLARAENGRLITPQELETVCGSSARISAPTIQASAASAPDAGAEDAATIASNP